MYGKELFSVYPEAPAETRSAVGVKMAFSEEFSVYLNNMRTSSVRCESASDLMAGAHESAENLKKPKDS